MSKVNVNDPEVFLDLIEKVNAAARSADPKNGSSQEVVHENVTSYLHEIFAVAEAFYNEIGRLHGEVAKLKEEKKELKEAIEGCDAYIIRQEERLTAKIVALRQENAALKEQISLQKG